MSWRGSKIFIVAVAAIAIFVDSLAYTIILPLLPTYQEQFQLTDSDVGLLVGMFSFTQIIGSLIFGWMIDRFEKNTRHALFSGLTALAVATVLFQLAQHYWVLVVARSIQGFAAAATWSSAMALIPRNLPESERGRATAVIMALSGLGSIVGPVLCGLLVWAGGQSMPFYVLTGVRRTLRARL
jgi:DHA1 family solute carrier family 18 vesicular amine transporter 1/2